MKPVAHALAQGETGRTSVLFGSQLVMVKVSQEKQPGPVLSQAPPCLLEASSGEQTIRLQAMPTPFGQICGLETRQPDSIGLFSQGWGLWRWRAPGSLEGISRV